MMQPIKGVRQRLWQRRRAILHGVDDLDSLTPGQRRELARIVLAMRRLGRGTYGLCAECGRRIETSRLDALPWATECAACAARHAA